MKEVMAEEVEAVVRVPGKCGPESSSREERNRFCLNVNGAGMTGVLDEE